MLESILQAKKSILAHTKYQFKINLRIILKYEFICPAPWIFQNKHWHLLSDKILVQNFKHGFAFTSSLNYFIRWALLEFYTFRPNLHTNVMQEQEKIKFTWDLVCNWVWFFFFVIILIVDFFQYAFFFFNF